MSRGMKLSSLLCVIVILTTSVTAITPGNQALQYLTGTSVKTEAIQGLNISLDDPNLNIKTYTFTPMDTSLPTFVDNADQIGPGFESWFAYDLSTLPEKAQIVSATFSAYIYNMSYANNNMLLYYFPDDSWIFVPDESFSDPGDYVTDGLEYIGSLWVNSLPESGFVWQTINLNYNGWSNDLADGRISFMLTCSQSGAVGLAPSNTGYSWGVLKAPELTLTVIEEPDEPNESNKEDKIYHDIFNLGQEEIVSAGSTQINVGTYSVPSIADWNNDGLKDLIVGTGDGYVRVYLNSGSNEVPKFSSNAYFYAQTESGDLYCPPSGCMGCFPRVVYWDNDSKKDLLVGQSTGGIMIFKNIGTDEYPLFDNGTYLTLDYVTEINVGYRAAPSVVDWNNDGKKDLICGAMDGFIHIFINEGTDTEPIFLQETYAKMANNATLSVPSGRSSPDVFDFNFDGRKDIITGNTNGQLLVYINTGTDKAPVFSDYLAVDSNDIPIDLAGTPRSRPFVGYWDTDGYPDVLIGAADGKVHLYRCKTLPADFNKDGAINLKDWAAFAGYWKQEKYDDFKAADFNNNGKVDMDDALSITSNWLLNIK